MSPMPTENTTAEATRTTADIIADMDAARAAQDAELRLHNTEANKNDTFALVRARQHMAKSEEHAARARAFTAELFK